MHKIYRQVITKNIGYYQEVNGQMPAEGAWEKYCMYLK